ncbi:MAG TPA: LLM class F420-dependent oxidoreductase, partial [Acidimicrobiales bacterium]|nr:LLM class F420-dependent oxidoreductase [Acidimicrobiales bacterium]
MRNPARAALDRWRRRPVRPPIASPARQGTDAPGRFKVGVQLHPQATTIGDLRAAWRAADELGVDSIWTWDHFFGLYGSPNTANFEAWTLLGAMAVETHHAMFGVLVSSSSYRNPDLLADMARTIDQLSGGRLYLGLGAGWFQRDYDEYGYPFGTAASRLRDLGAALPRVKARLAQLNPPPVGRLPLLIGGGGEKVTLRLVAEHADAWNTFGPVESYAHKNRVLDDWCARVGRDPTAIERTVAIDPSATRRADDFVAAGAEHIIVMIGHPFDLSSVKRLLS